MVAKMIQKKVQFQKFCQLIFQPFQIVFLYQIRICWKFFIRYFLLNLHKILEILQMEKWKISFSNHKSSFNDYDFNEKIQKRKKGERDLDFYSFKKVKMKKTFTNFIIGAIKRPLQSFQPFKIPFLRKKLN